MDKTGKQIILSYFVFLFFISINLFSQNLKDFDSRLYEMVKSGKDPKEIERIYKEKISNDSLINQVWKNTDSDPYFYFPNASQANAVSFSQNGTILAVGSEDGKIYLWNVTTGVFLGRWDGQSGRVKTLSFSPDGTKLASGCIDGRVRLWNAINGNLINKWDAHSGEINSLSFSPDGIKLATGSNDNTVKLWMVNSGSLLKTLDGHYSTIYSVTFSPDGLTLASAGGSRVILWDANLGNKLKTLSQIEVYASSVAYSPDGMYLASGASNNIIKLWNVNSGNLIKTLYGHTGTVSSLCFSNDGTKLISGSSDFSIKIWNVSSGSVLNTLNGHTSYVTSIALTKDGTTIASAGYDKNIKIWKYTDGSLIKTLTGHESSINSVAYSSDGTKLVSGGSDKKIILWSSTGSLLNLFTGHTDVVKSVDISPDGSKIISGSIDKTIKIWNAITGGLISTLSDHSDVVTSVVFSSDGTKFASGSNDKTIKLWNANDGSFLKTFTGHTGSVTAIAISPDGSKLASGSSDKTIKIWDVITGGLITTISGHSDYVSSLVFSPDGTKIASGGNKEIRINNVSTGNLIKSWIAHESSVASIKFSPDGQKLASSSADEMLKIWDPATGNNMLTLHQYGWLNSIAYNNDGNKILLGCAAGYLLRIIDISYWNNKITGEVYGTWLKSNSPYYIGSDLTVPSGKKLIIEPGVKILVSNIQGEYVEPIKITVLGSLEAIGTAYENIIFSSADANPIPGSWIGINVNPTSTYLFNSREKINADKTVFTSNTIKEKKLERDIESIENVDDKKYLSTIIASDQVKISYCKVEYANTGITLNKSADISNSDISNNKEEGISITGASDFTVYGTINNCNIYNNGSNGIGCHAWYGNTSTSNVRTILNYNKIHNNKDNGIFVESNGDLGNNVTPSLGCTAAPTIESNEIYDNINSGIYFFASGTTDSYMQGRAYRRAWIDTKLFKNIIRNNKNGIKTYSSYKYNGNYLNFITISNYHNTFYNNSDAEITLSDSACMTADNSIFWNLSKNPIQNTSVGQVSIKYSDLNQSYPGTGNISSDPLFLSPLTNDFHLTMYSPCIDKGNPDSTKDTDGTITDIGAFYYPQIPLSSFSLTSPADNIITTGFTPSLQWSHALQIPDNSLSYDLYYNKGNAFDQAGATIITGIKNNSYTFASPLSDTSTYYWRVLAKMGAQQKWSNEIWKFTIKTDAVPPVFINWQKLPSDINEESTSPLKVTVKVTDEGVGIKTNKPLIAYKIGKGIYSDWITMQKYTIMKNKKTKQKNEIESETVKDEPEKTAMDSSSWSYDIPFPNGGWKTNAGDTIFYKVMCTDVYQNTGISSEQIEVIESVKRAPVITALPGISFLEDQKYNLPLSNIYNYVEDKKYNDSLLTYNFSDGKNITATFQNKNLELTPKLHWYGKDSVKLKVINPDNLSDSTYLNITVLKINYKPSAYFPESVILKQDSSYTIKVWDYVEDVETSDTMLTYDFRTDNDSLLLNFNNLTGILKLVSYQFVGNASLFVKISDDSNAVALDTVKISVQYGKRPPSIAVLPQIIFNEDQKYLLPLTEIYKYVEDKKYHDSLLTYNLSEGKNIAVKLQNNNIELTPKLHWFGKDTLKLKATNPEYLSDSAYYYVTVLKINHKPAVYFPESIIIKQDSSFMMKVWDYVEDVETPDSLLNYEIKSNSDSIMLNYNNTTGVLRIVPFKFMGDASLFIKITDDSLALVRDTILIKVRKSLSVERKNDIIPVNYELSQNYPNPFNPSTTISYQLPFPGKTNLSIFNTLTHL